jgi:hypothetical protein
MNRTLLSLLVAAAPLAAASCSSTSALAPESPEAALRATADADPKARELAERVARSMGGWQAWHDTRYVTWRFFGGRAHAWDKRTGDWRLDDGDRVVLMNVDTRQGRVFEKGVEVTDPAAREAALKRAHEVWINDSYWMFMPWKMLDPGVVLRYVGATALEDERSAQLVEMTFRGVGVTPDNRYLVAIGDESGLVEHWSFFASAGDETPKLSLPWTGWKRFGSILLCTDHGVLPGPQNAEKKDWRIDTPAELPREVFTDPAQRP